MNENFATLWESLVDSMPDHEAVVSGDRRITFSARDGASSLDLFGGGRLGWAAGRERSAVRCRPAGPDGPTARDRRERGEHHASGRRLRPV